MPPIGPLDPSGTEGARKPRAPKLEFVENQAGVQAVRPYVNALGGWTQRAAYLTGRKLTAVDDPALSAQITGDLRKLASDVKAAYAEFQRATESQLRNSRVRDVGRAFERLLLLLGPQGTTLGQDDLLAGTLSGPRRRGQDLKARNRPMTKKDDLKRPHEVAGCANQPQHLAGEYGGPPGNLRRREGLPTGEGTGAGDVADPHPSNEEHYDRERHPGGARSNKDPGPNDALHNGHADRRPPSRKGAP